MNRLNHILFCFCFFLFFSCGGGGQSSSVQKNFDKKEMLSYIGEMVIVSSYNDFYNKSIELKESKNNFLSNKNEESFLLLKNAWRVVQSAWEKTEIFNFGPAMTGSYEFDIDYTPIRRNLIESALLEKTEFVASDFDTIAAAAKGLPVVEYFLYSTDFNVNLESLVSSEIKMSYLSALIDYNEIRAKELLEDWLSSKGGFVNGFSNPGSAGSVYKTELEAISALVNQVIHQLEYVRDSKVGKPLGLSSGGVISIDSVENFYSRTSLLSIKANIDGIKALFDSSSNSINLNNYLEKLNSDLAFEIVTKLTLLNNSLADKNDSLVFYLETDKLSVEDLYEKLDALLRLIKVDMSNLMGITISSSDNDGD